MKHINIKKSVEKVSAISSKGNIHFAINGVNIISWSTTFGENDINEIYVRQKSDLVNSEYDAGNNFKTLKQALKYFKKG